MSQFEETAMLTLLAGSFDNQAEAFQALLEEAAVFDIEIGPHQADVIREAREVRMAHYFRPAIVAKIEEARESSDTVIVLFPSQLTAEPRFPTGHGALRLIGRFAGRMTYS